MFSPLTLYFVDSIYNLMRQIYKFGTFSTPNAIKTNMPTCLWKYMKIRWHFLEFDLNGRVLLNRQGAYSKYFAQKRGAYWRGGLIEFLR